MRLAWLVVALLFAGCANAPEASTAALPANESAASVPTLPSASFEVPIWQAGDAWFVDIYNGDERSEGVLVVAAADAAAFTVVTTSEQTAMFDAAFDVSYVGKIRARDLAGAQKDKTIQFFDFPLSEGKVWSTPWDSTTVNLTATFAPVIATPLGPQPGFVIKGEARGKPYVEYDYVPALNWWSRIAFGDNYGFTVTKVAHNWTGEYKVATSKTILNVGTAVPVASTPVGAFTVDKDQTMVLLTLTLQAMQHARAFVLLDPANQPFVTKNIGEFEASPAETRVFATENLPPTAGEWKVLAPVVHDPAGSFALSAREIAIVSKTL